MRAKIVLVAVVIAFYSLAYVIIGPAVDPVWVAPMNERTQPKPAVKPDRSWHRLATAQLAAIDVERTLYEREDDPAFYIRVRVTNRTARPLGTDLREFWRVIFPYQWALSYEEIREGTIDERIFQQDVDQKLAGTILANYAANELTIIPPSSSLSYYRGYSGDFSSARADKGKSFYIGLGGEQRFTDGATVEQITCDWPDVAHKAGIDPKFSIPMPLAWRAIPKDALVISRK
jgi:hypothetical protein